MNQPILKCPFNGYCVVVDHPANTDTIVVVNYMKWVDGKWTVWQCGPIARALLTETGLST